MCEGKNEENSKSRMLTCTAQRRTKKKSERKSTERKTILVLISVHLSFCVSFEYIVREAFICCCCFSSFHLFGRVVVAVVLLVSASRLLRFRLPFYYATFVWTNICKVL